MTESLAPKSTQQLKTALERIHKRIQQAAEHANRSVDEISLLAVSKKQPLQQMKKLYSLGQGAFGESYTSEAKEKQYNWKTDPVEWHFIGPLQSNKTQYIAEHFQWVQSVDRAKLISRLASQRPPQQAPLNICIQINISAETNKGGCRPGELWDLAQQVASHSNLRLRGIMSIGSKQAESSEYQQMQQLFSLLHARYPQVDTLSMGMSADLETAIDYGATLVRIGNDLFGPRENHHCA